MLLMVLGPNTDLFRFWLGGTTASLVHFTLNEATDSITFVWSQPESATITRVGVRQQTITGTAPTYRLSLQGVAGDGNEDGVIKGSGNCFVDYTPIAANNTTFFWLNLNQSYTASAGEMLALVIQHQSGTINASNNAQFSVTSAVGEGGAYGIPYVIQNDNSTRSRNTSTPVFGIGSSTRAYGLPAHAVSGGSTFSSPVERACRFQLPGTLVSSAVVVGAKIYMLVPAAGAAEVCLYTDGGTLLTSITYDGDWAQSNAAGRPYVIYFPSAITVTAGQWYRLSLRPTAGAWLLPWLAVADEADWDAWGWRSFAHGSERSGSASWTDQLTRRYAIQPLFGLVDEGRPSLARLVNGV